MEVGKPLLIHRATGEVIKSFDAMEEKLYPLGWRRIPSDDFAFRVYKKKRNVIRLPDDWNHLQEFQLIEVVIKSGCAFETRITTSEDLN
jgi:hypothetical protein